MDSSRFVTSNHSMTKLRKQNRIKISYAKDALGKFLTITGAASGRRGYFCLDCHKELEAVKPLGPKPRPYFRHVASNVRVDEHPCTYSDETYRHKIAKEVLVRTKSIRVPRVPKFPPEGFDGPVKEVRPARTIIAHSVLVERDFYEDENQNLCWGRIEARDKTGIIRPDVIFLDATCYPILFIELVATHKPDFEKLAKIKRLGIDTVTVKVPTESPEAIEDCFLKTYYTKWFFNNDQERADYIQLSGSSGERISDVDEVQRQLFEESFLCRKNRIRNLIRAFDSCVLTEQYRSIESGIRNEIERIDDERRRRVEFESEIDSEISQGFDERRTALREREAKLERLCKYLKGKEGELEDDTYNEFVEVRGKINRKDVRLDRLRERIADRYERKRNILEDEEREFTRVFEEQSATSDREFQSANIEEGRIRYEIARTDRAIDEAEGEIRDARSQLESLPEAFEQQRSELEEQYTREAERLQTEFNELEAGERRIIEGFRREEAEFEDRARSARTQLINRFDELKKKLNDSAAQRDSGGDTAMSGEIKSLVSTGQLLSDYQAVFRSFERCREALRFLNTEAFKAWIKGRRI